MKKLFNIALTAMLALAFGACDDVDQSNGIPVVNPQQPIMPADGISASDIVAEGGNVNLDAAKTTGLVDMIKVTKIENFPADQTLKIVMNVSANADMKPSQAIDLNVIPGTDAGAVFIGQADTEKFDAAFKSLVSRDPSAKKMYANYVAYALDGPTTVLLGAIGTPQSVLVTPYGYEHPLENEYFVYGTLNDNSIANAVKLAHEGNPYDSPVFKVKVSITSDQIKANGGWKFKVIPASTKNAGQTWEQNHNRTFIGAGAKSGQLAYATADADAQWVVIEKPGDYMLNVNVLDLTYELSNAIEYLYVPGANNDWSTWSTKLGTTDYINYGGVANLTGDFKFTGTAGWNADLGNYGAGKTNYTLLNGSNENFKLDGTPGLYWINVNLAGLKYTKNAIKTLSVIGSHNGWDLATATPLVPSDDNLTWEAVVEFSAGGEYKFNANGKWDISFGGAEDDIVYNGGNLHTPGSGTYLIVVDFSALPYQCYLEEQ